MKTLRRTLLSALVAAALLWILMVWGDVRPDAIVDALRSLSVGELALAVAIHAGIYALRAFRFRLLVPPEHRPGYGRALVVSAAHNLAAYVLPAKTGEASFVVYLKGTAGVSAARGLASLLVSRLLDLAVLSLGLSVACLTLASTDAEGALPAWFAPLGGALLAATLVFGLLGARGHLLVSVFERGARFVGLERTRLGARVLDRARDVEDAFESAGGDGRLLGGALVSVPLWALVFTFYAVLARGFGLPESTGFFEAAFGSSLAVLFNLLPVNGLAGFGTQEAGWTFGFGLLGIDAELALATGVGAHFVQLLDVALFGLLAHVVMGMLPPPTRSAETSPGGASPSA